jgi:hypothetical protein
MFPGLLPLIGAGLLLAGAFLFWAAVQNWLSEAIARLEARFNQAAYRLQTALIVLDRVVVNGQRLIVATLRLVAMPEASSAPQQVEEVKTIRREDLPAEVREKLERGQRLQYTLSVGNAAGGAPRAESRDERGHVTDQLDEQSAQRPAEHSE